MPGPTIAAVVESKGGTKPKGTPAKVAAALQATQAKWEAAKRAASNLRTNMKDTAMNGVHVAETQGTVLATEVAAGYFGEERLYVGGVDAPGVLGAATGLWGLYEEATGGDGSHQLAVGNGLLATAVGRLGRSIGRKLADRSGAPPAPGVPPNPVVQGDDVGALRRITQQHATAPRMPMLMTPAAEPEAAPPRADRKGKLLNWAKRLREREGSDE